MLAVLRRMLAGEAVTQADSGLSKREWTEFQAALEAALITYAIRVDFRGFQRDTSTAP